MNQSHITEQPVGAGSMVKRLIGDLSGEETISTMDRE